MGSSSKSRASPPAPCSIFGLYSALPSRGSQLRRHQCRRLAMSKHYETSCSASPPSASQLLHSLRPLVNVSSPPSASLSSAACFITALRDQLLPVPHLRSSAEQMLHCSSTAARHAGSVCDRLVTNPVWARSRPQLLLSTKVLCYRALVELAFDRQARSGAVCKARSSTAQGAHETVVKGLSNIRP